MTAYDDAETSCPICTVGLDAAALCECPDEPMCVRCHRAYHVETSNVLRQGGAA